MFVAELCVLRTFGGADFSLIFIGAQSVSEFLWDRLRASIQFPVVPKRAQYARFSGECRYSVYSMPQTWSKRAGKPQEMRPLDQNYGRTPISQ
eukprot:COSAG02_NODE_1447_length_12575_cov_8.479400_3_plen_93_part_00